MASLREPDPVPILGELLDQYGDLTAEARSRYLPGLHAEFMKLVQTTMRNRALHVWKRAWRGR